MLISMLLRIDDWLVIATFSDDIKLVQLVSMGMTMFVSLFVVRLCPWHLLAFVYGVFSHSDPENLKITKVSIAQKFLHHYVLWPKIGIHKQFKIKVVNLNFERNKFQLT